jgi:hypothetical protein
MAKRKHEEEEWEELEEEVDEDEDALEEKVCKLCDSETEIGKELCEDCAYCAACGDEWKFKVAKDAKKTEDGRVCATCFEEEYSDDDHLDEDKKDDEDEDEDSDDEEYELDVEEDEEDPEDDED